MRTTIAIFLLIGAFQTATQLSEKETIDWVRNSLVRGIDRTLPDETLEAWLRGLFGSAKTSWETNDCGEQTGNPQLGRGRDFPMCVDVTITLDDRRVLHLLLAVGTLKTGARRAPPTFFYGVVVEGGVPPLWLKTLGEATKVGGGRGALAVVGSE